MTAAVVALGNRTFSSLHAHRNFRLFYAGQVVSLAGSWMQHVALAWLVIALGGSPLAVGVLAVSRFLPFTLLGLFAGIAIDRVDTRRLVMATQTSAMAVSAALWVVVATGFASLPLVFVLSTLGGIALVFDAPGRQALTYELVGPQQLPNAVALNSGLLNASRVIGPALAGVLIATAGIGWCFALNTISFLAVLVALALIRPGELHPIERARRTRLAAELREGLSFVAGARELRAVLLLVMTVSAVGFNFNVLVPLLASDGLHVQAREFGLLAAVFGLGALTGALASAALARASRRALVGGAIGFSSLMLALGWVGTPATAAVLLYAVGFFFTVFTSSANALVQLRAPDHLRGRIISLYLFSFVGLAPLGGLLSGWLVELGGTELAFTVAGLVGLASTQLARRGLQPRVG